VPKQSAGLLVYRRRNSALQVFLVHPGGPFAVKKDEGAWSIPKGEFETGEEPLAAAIRELQEETGFTVKGPFVSLGTIRQAGGKTVYAFAIEADFDPTQLVSNTFSMEWPPRSGKITEFAEVDRGDWFPVEVAAVKINPAQAAFLTRLAEAVTD
jgi:predicted NUDIX family NTP pyrophosphohydrolase